MARAPSPEQLAEYEHDKAFCLALAGFWDQIVRLTPPGKVGTQGPGGEMVWSEGPRLDLSFREAIAEGLAEAESSSFTRARTALRLGLQDLLEMTSDLPADVVRSVDEHFAQLGLEPLTSVRARVWRTLEKVLKRGRIRSETEYYLVMDRLNDVSPGGPSDEQRERFGEAVREYERRAG